MTSFTLLRLPLSQHCKSNANIAQLSNFLLFRWQIGNSASAIIQTHVETIANCRLCWRDKCLKLLWGYHITLFVFFSLWWFDGKYFHGVIFCGNQRVTLEIRYRGVNILMSSLYTVTHRFQTPIGWLFIEKR